MKLFIPILLMMVSQLQAQTCRVPEFMTWSQERGNHCAIRMVDKASEENCLPLIFPQLKNFEDLLGAKELPWWATQGKLLFPNVESPGVWKNHKIDASFYPGEGEIFAGKPNIYIQSIHDEKKMKFRFFGQAPKHFLATTPMLSERNSWEGKIVERDKFEIDGTYYDYLFYDIRLPRSFMQFQAGVCISRKEVIEWMLNDLKAMDFPPISLSDFEEHWRVKIPDYPFFCIYPQYNEQLDVAVPVALDLEQSSLTRVLYVLIPSQGSPELEGDSQLSPPTQNPEFNRPATKIQRENMFKEWGVAFLGE